MTTIDAEVTINETGEVSVQVPVTPNVSSGHYRAVLVLETQDNKPTPPIKKEDQEWPFTFKPTAWGYYPPDFTFRREEF